MEAHNKTIFKKYMWIFRIHTKKIEGSLKSDKNNEYLHEDVCKGEGKAFPLQAWTGPWGSRTLRLQNF
jgi:hypothetical protein